MRCDNYFEVLRPAAADLPEGGRFRWRRGFSLIEVLVVIVIIAIAAAVAVPMFSSGGSFQIRAAANIIAADLEYAKSMAITRGQSYSVVFTNSSSESYHIEDQSGNPVKHPITQKLNYIVDFKSDSRLSSVVITKAQFDPGASNTVTFDSMGMPYSGNTVNPINSLNDSIITISADGATTTIRVEPVTGYISIN